MTVKFIIRTAQPADAARVTALLETSYGVLMAPSYDHAALAAALPVMARANPVLLLSGNFSVAEAEGGVLAGCGGWSHERPGSGETESGLGHIRHFGIHPDWTGQGIGRAIYDRCAIAARAARVTRLECYSSLNAEGFYAALGFKPLRPAELSFGEGVTLPALLMDQKI